MAGVGEAADALEAVEAVVEVALGGGGREGVNEVALFDDEQEEEAVDEDAERLRRLTYLRPWGSGRCASSISASTEQRQILTRVGTHSSWLGSFSKVASPIAALPAELPAPPSLPP